MAGDIFFTRHHWASSSSTILYVLRYLADRAADAATRDKLTELVENNIPMLDLRDPQLSPLVDIIADELPGYVKSLHDSELRESLTAIFKDLYRFASEQQEYNSDPTQDIYFTIGPGPAKAFKMDILKLTVERHLNDADYVTIDVSDYSAEQRAMVRDYVAELANPRVLITGD